MAIDVSDAFITQFESEVHAAYQRKGSKLRPTVRVQSAVQGQKTTFQKVGTGTASTKSRHGQIAAMNVSHTPVECSLTDYYAGDWCDKLDLLKLNIDERMVLADAGAWALGRKTDSLITTAMATSSNSVGVQIGGSSTDVGLNQTKVFAGFQELNENDVPDDGGRYCAVGAKQWNELLGITAFASSDYVGQGGELPFTLGVTAKKWLGMTFFMHSGLPLVNTDERQCFMYHRSSVGHAVGADIMTDITWHGDRASWFINHMMSQGSCLIDANGCVIIVCQE